MLLIKIININIFQNICDTPFKANIFHYTWWSLGRDQAKDCDQRKFWFFKHMYVCMILCMYVHMYVCIYACMCVAIHVWVYFMHNLHVNIQVCTYVNRHVWIFVYKYVFVYMHVWMSAYTYNNESVHVDIFLCRLTCMSVYVNNMYVCRQACTGVCMHVSM